MSSSDAEPRMEVDDGIVEAITEAVRAGVYRKAERLNPQAADVFAKIARPHSRRANACLNATMRRLGVKRPCR